MNSIFIFIIILVLCLGGIFVHNCCATFSMKKETYNPQYSPNTVYNRNDLITSPEEKDAQNILRGWINDNDAEENGGGYLQETGIEAAKPLQAYDPFNSQKSYL